jgi:hypothetical protein
MNAKWELLDFSGAPTRRARGYLILITAMIVLLGTARGSAVTDTAETFLRSPQVGDHALRILAPNLLELVRVNTRPA